MLIICSSFQGLSSYKNTRPTTVEELGSVLDKMRTHSTTVESNLGKISISICLDLQFI